MDYHVQFPIPELTQFVEKIAFLDNHNKTITLEGGRFIPNGTCSLVFHFKDSFTLNYPGRQSELLPSSFFVGQVFRPTDLKPGNILDTMMVMFKPTGLYHIFGIQMEGLCKQLYIDSEGFLQASDIFTLLKNAAENNIRWELINTYLLDVLKRKQPIIFDHVEMAVDVINQSCGTRSIEDIAHNLNIPHRKLRQDFIKKVGITPKLFARIVRVNSVLDLLNSDNKLDWHDITFSMGYYDQAHFIKDFQMITGYSPTKLMNYSGVRLDILAGK